MKNIYIASFVVALAIVGAYFFPRSKIEVRNFGTTTSGGTTLTPGQATVAINLASPGANGTSTTLFNSSANDYYITGVKAACQGIGTSKTVITGAALASLTLKVATSSSAAPADSPSSNLVTGGTFTIATSTVNFALSSTTSVYPNGYNGVNNVWPSGTYIDFTVNATNTAVCTVGVDYFSL